MARKKKTGAAPSKAPGPHTPPGQVGIEMFSLYGILLVPILVAFYVAYAGLSVSTASLSASSAVTETARVLEDLSTQGRGATALTTIMVPNGFDPVASYIGTPFSCAGPFVSLSAQQGGYLRTVNTRAIGEWPSVPGFHTMGFTVQSPGIVVIEPVHQAPSAAASRQWVLASIGKRAGVVRFDPRQTVNATGLLSDFIVREINGTLVPALMTVFYNGQTNFTSVQVVCVDESLPSAVTASPSTTVSPSPTATSTPTPTPTPAPRSCGSIYSDCKSSCGNGPSAHACDNVCKNFHDACVSNTNCESNYQACIAYPDILLYCEQFYQACAGSVHPTPSPSPTPTPVPAPSASGCAATALYQNASGAWTAVSLGGSALTGVVTVFNATFTPPSGFRNLTIRASASSTTQAPVTFQQPLLLNGPNGKSSFLVSFITGALTQSGYADGACNEPGAQPCANGSLRLNNDYRAYGIAGAGNTATCHLGAW